MELCTAKQNQNGTATVFVDIQLLKEIYFAETYMIARIIKRF